MLEAAQGRQQSWDMDRETRSVILEHNRLDMELSRFAAELFERQMKDLP
jgi:hypothetical protein